VPDDTGEHDVIECNRPAHQDGHHGPECYGGDPLGDMLEIAREAGAQVGELAKLAAGSPDARAMFDAVRELDEDTSKTLLAASVLWIMSEMSAMSPSEEDDIRANREVLDEIGRTGVSTAEVAENVEEFLKQFNGSSITGRWIVADERIKARIHVAQGPGMFDVEGLKRDLAALDAACDLTPHIDVESLKPWPNPPEVDSA
jgi:hypothetical protein